MVRSPLHRLALLELARTVSLHGFSLCDPLHRPALLKLARAVLACDFSSCD